LQIDAGYIKTRLAQGSGWIPVVTSKIVQYDGARGYAHAYATNIKRKQGLRQQAFLKKLGVSPQSPVTVMSDGGDDIGLACKLPTVKLRVLDRFHIGTRFEQLSIALSGLQGADADTKEELLQHALSARRYLWHGRQDQSCKILEQLRRETGWVGARNPLGKLLRYLQGCSRMLVNYALRRSRGLSISSAGAESS
jgi:hypothetical protein